MSDCLPIERRTEFVSVGRRPLCSVFVSGLSGSNVSDGGEDRGRVRRGV